MSSVKRWIMLVLVAAAAVFPSSAATLEQLSLDDLIAKSTAIVRGAVTSSWTAASGSVIYTHYKVQVYETLLGTAAESVEVMTPGGTLNGVTASYSGSPVLAQGQEYVLFLWRSKSGITWITGLTQGLFALPSGTGSDRTATRAASRELMLDRTTGRPVKDAALSLKLNDLRGRIATVQGGAK
jgi:hypothetical protein